MEEFVKLIDWMGNDLTVVNAARVSMGKRHQEFDPESDTKLIHYLARHNHISVFFHPQLTFWIKMPIFVARQWDRSVVGIAKNEVSRRYVDDEPEIHLPSQLRSRPSKNIKQGSGEPLSVEANEAFLALMEEHYRNGVSLYNFLLSQNVAPEQARMILPQSMYTEFYWTASLAAVSRVCKLRLDPHAQRETQEYASAVAELTAERFPVSWAALMGVEGTKDE
jgi:thymidylate synthase (FAD)